MGDYSADPIDDSDDTWTMNTVMDNELEFEFDSYGPESMIYAENIDANHKNAKNAKNAKTQMPNDTVQKVLKESDGSVENGVSPSIESNETANNVEIILDNNEITCQMTDTDTFEPPSTEQNQFSDNHNDPLNYYSEDINDLRKQCDELQKHNDYLQRKLTETKTRLENVKNENELMRQIFSEFINSADSMNNIQITDRLFKIYMKIHMVV